MSKKDKPYYVNPLELKNEVIKYKTTGEISNELGTMFINIATRFASRPNFSGYTYKDEFIGDAIYRMCHQIKMIDLNHPKCNIFTYLTMICYHCFVARINKEKRYQKTKEDVKKEIFNEFMLTENIKPKQNDYDDESNFNEVINHDVNENPIEDLEETI